MTTPPPDLAPLPGAPLLLFPGMVSEPTPLVDLLREAHAGEAAARLAEIDRRKAQGIPRDEATVWRDVAALVDVVGAAVTAHDGEATRAAALRILETTAPPLAPLPDFVPPAGLEGVVVVLRTMSAADLARVRARKHAASRAWGRAKDDDEARAAANELAYAAWGEMITGSIVEVHGLAAAPVRMTSALIDGLRRSGFLEAFHDAADHFQGLAPGKAKLSGSSPLST